MSSLGRVAIQAGSCFALVLWAGCGAPESSVDDEPAPRVKTQPVYGGIISPEENDAVVELRMPPEKEGDSNRICSGTVVAPRLVITARHCIAPYIGGEYQCNAEGGYNEGSPRDPANAGTVGQPYNPPDQVEIRVGQQAGDSAPAFGEKIYIMPTETICKNDIAIVRVDRDIPVAPRAMRLTEPTYPHELVTVVGYGLTHTVEKGRHERHDVEIEAVGKSEIYPVGRGAYDRTFRLGQAACPGDSGGPSLSDKGAVVGVFSIIVHDCGSAAAQNYYTQLAPFRDFIEAAFDDSGFEVIHEPGTGPDGSAGAPSDSDGSGGSQATGGSAGEAATTMGIIPGRKKKKDGCSVAVAGDSVSGNRGDSTRWAPLLLGLGLLAVRRRRQAKRR